MPEVISDNTLLGEPLHEWTVQEYQQHQHPRAWYLIMGMVGIGCVAYGLFTNNFLFALIVILFGIISYLQSHQTPPQVSFVITDTGVIVGNRFYPYSEFSAFYIIYRPPEVKTLYLETRSAFRPTLRIPFLDENPLPIRDSLLRFLTEDVEKETEPISDQLGREWQLH